MSDNNDKKQPNNTNTKNTLQRQLTAGAQELQRRITRETPWDPDHGIESASGGLRGIAAALRKVAFATKKAVIAKGPIAAKKTIRAVGENRPLAFASEGAVAGESVLPRVLYYGAWGLSGAAIGGDIFNKYEDCADPSQKWNTVYYWTAFHLPASLLVPAYLIHQIVHQVERVVQNPQGFAKSWSPRVKSAAPVAAALLSIIPIVPTVDAAAEMIMEPTLGAYLGLEFEHQHHGDDKNGAAIQEERKETKE